MPTSVLVPAAVPVARSLRSALQATLLLIVAGTRPCTCAILLPIRRWCRFSRPSIAALTLAMSDTRALINGLVNTMRIAQSPSYSPRSSQALTRAVSLLPRCQCVDVCTFASWTPVLTLRVVTYGVDRYGLRCVDSDLLMPIIYVDIGSVTRCCTC